MPFGNSERSWLDEFWSLWHCDRPVDLEASEPHDLWAYDDKKESAPIHFDTHYCHLTPLYDPASSPKIDET